MSKDVFAAKGPHFFKLILPNGTLRIPRNFLRKYGGLASTVYLKLPSGVEWEVGLTKHDGDVWFQNGWQEFSKYCSLDFGHLLVFRYEGNSRFHVLIFDTTAVEIDYPFYSTQSKDDNTGGEFQVPNLEEINSDNSLEIIDDLQPIPKARAKPSSPCLQPQKRPKTNPSDKTDCTPNLQTLSHHFRHEDIHSECLRSNYSQASEENEEGGGMCFTKRCPKSEVIERMQQSSEEARALKSARTFKSKNPFFMVVMWPSYINSKRGLHLPYKFGKTYFNVKDGNTMLLVYNGRTWSVKFTSIGKKRRGETKLTCGWNEFVVDNNLEVGDVCAFELINGFEMLFDVKIFRGAAKNAKRCSSPANEGVDGMRFTKRGPKSMVIERLQQLSEAGALRRARAFKSENPFFIVVMRPSYINTRCGLNIPGWFLKRYIKEIRGKLTLQVEDKLWHMKMHYYPQNSYGALNSAGWSTFARENMLQVGYVCVFELIKRDDIVLKVCIFRRCD